MVVCHDTGRLVWMAPGRDAATVRAFFDALGEERTAALELVSADGAAWIDEAVREKAPHVVRRGVWNGLRRGGQKDAAAHLKGARWALWKNPENLNAKQKRTLAWVEKTNAPLFRAYLLKEGLRGVFQARSPAAGGRRLDTWLAWAQRSRLTPFVKLARSIRSCRERIDATLQHGLTNARIEATNTQLRLLTRIAHGFHHMGAFINLAMLKLAGLCPHLPGR